MTIGKSPVEAFCSIEYDYVIVGGGTAGLVLAARLSENGSINVGVLEAGELKQDDPSISTPLLCSSIQGDPSYDWMFKTVPQSSIDNRVLNWPRGKVVGGSSCINNQVFVHGSPEEYDDWEALGNKGWNWKNLSPYFKKVESFRPIVNGQASARKAYNLSDHGTTGPVETTITNDLIESNELWNAAWNNLGIPTVVAAGNSLVGTQYTKSSISATSGTRSSSLSSYFTPNAARANLHLLPEALVSSVLFSSKEGGDLVAIGVQFSAAGKHYRCRAAKEIILSAGVVQSPGILERSGIGSKDILDACGVKTLVNNPGVGENLQDHTYTVTVHQVSDEKYSLDAPLASPEFVHNAMSEYKRSQTGFFASAINTSTYISYKQICQHAGPMAAILEGTSTSSRFKKQYDLQLRRFDKSNVPSFQFMLSPLYAESILPSPKPDGIRGCVGIMNILSAPFSRGSIHITTAQPEVGPSIDPRYMEHPADEFLLSTASRQGLEVAATTPLSEVLDKVVLPARPLSTNEEGREFCRQTLGSFFHQIGTCSMMPREDGGVVDSNLIVYGTKNLRVVDASIFPLHLSGNIQWTVYAMAERSADIIKGHEQ